MKHVEKSACELAFQESSAVVERTAEYRLGLVQAARHSRVLRALPGKQPCDRWSAIWHSAGEETGDLASREIGQPLDCRAGIGDRQRQTVVEGGSGCGERVR